MSKQYTVERICSQCGLIRVVSKYVKNSTGMCRKCSTSFTGSRTWSLNNKSLRTHGLTDTKLYKVWLNIKQRCSNPHTKSWAIYGGRGIELCRMWRENFVAFSTWAQSHGYQEGLQIDRIDTNGNYEPKNCRWVSQKENCRNTRSNVLTQELAAQIRALVSAGEKQNSVAAKFGVSPQTVNHVVKGKQWA